MPKRTIEKSLPTTKQVNATLASVRKFWSLGRSSRERSTRLPGGKATGLAEEAGLRHAELLRKARQVSEVFSAVDLRKLFAACRNAKFLLGRTHLIRLAPLQATLRRQLQNEMVRKRWTLVELENAIAQRKPPPPNVGRLPWVPKDGKGLLVQIVSYSRRWLKWCNAVQFAKTSSQTSRLGKNLLNKLKATKFKVGAIEKAAVNRLGQTY